MAPNKVLQKKKTVDQNLKLAIIKEQEEPISFGVNGTSFNLGASGVIDTREEEKETVVGRRDIFRLPVDPLVNDVRIKKLSKRQAIVKQKTSMLAKLTSGEPTEGFGLDFNIAGTQIGGINPTLGQQNN